MSLTSTTYYARLTGPRAVTCTELILHLQLDMHLREYRVKTYCIIRNCNLKFHCSFRMWLNVVWSRYQYLKRMSILLLSTKISFMYKCNNNTYYYVHVYMFKNVSHQDCSLPYWPGQTRLGMRHHLSLVQERYLQEECGEFLRFWHHIQSTLPPS